MPSTERLDAPLRTADARLDAEVRACGPTVNEDVPVERAPQEQAERAFLAPPDSAVCSIPTSAST